MFKHSLVWIFLVPLSMCGSWGRSRRRRLSCPRFHAGPGHDRRTECHDTRIIVQQRLSNAAGRKKSTR